MYIFQLRIRACAMPKQDARHSTLAKTRAKLAKINLILQFSRLGMFDTTLR